MTNNHIVVDADRVDEECPSCRSHPSDRAKREDYEGLRKCQHCGSMKCSLCDMGDDVECPSCG